MADFTPTTIARFWSKVAVGRDADCWPWRGGEDYGRFRIDGTLYLPHRLAYELVKGPIPDMPGYHGAVIMHRCDNPACCNPSHLRVGSQRDNVIDMDQKGRRKWAKPNARLTPEQVRKIRDDPRACRLLARIYGVGRSQVLRIKNGERWADLA